MKENTYNNPMELRCLHSVVNISNSSTLSLNISTFNHIRNIGKSKWCLFYDISNVTHNLEYTFNSMDLCNHTSKVLLMFNHISFLHYLYAFNRICFSFILIEFAFSLDENNEISINKRIRCDE